MYKRFERVKPVFAPTFAGLYNNKMFENKAGRTELSQMGEFGLIRLIADSVKLNHPTSLKGIGDDAAVIENQEETTVVTTDLLLENIHFDLSYCPLKHLGYKSVIVNLSDIYAMNAEPRQIVIGLGLSNRFSLDAVEELYSGIRLACEIYNVDLVGGDTSSSSSGLVISITAIGTSQKENLVYRNGAKLNDLICVTGDLGAAYMGLQLLQREKQVYLETPTVQPDLSGYDYLLERQLKPEARKDIIRYLKDLKIKPTSMIDISDGLSSELMHICTQSRVGCQVYEKKIPVDHLTRELAMEFGIDTMTAAMNGGEDYELLFTIALSDYEKIKDRSEILIIGHITDVASGYSLVDKQNNVHPLTAQGWNSLANK